MGDTEEYDGIEEAYEDVEAEVSREEFREAVERKVEQMGGLADEETAAMLVVHELDDGGEVETVADVEPGMDEAAFEAKVTDVGELRSFDRDDGSEGRVLNADVADETGSIRVTFWDEMAVEAADELEVGDVLGIAGRPAEGYAGVEVNVDDVDPDPDAEVDVSVGGTTPVGDLAMGMSGVTVRGRVLDVGTITTFDRDDGSEGRVANLTLGDETGRIRVTGWDEMAEVVADRVAGESVEVVDGYVKEREGELELHVNDRSAVEGLEESVRHEPDATPIADIEIGQQVDLSGVVRSADPKRTFDRDDGSEGQVRNVRIQDDTGDIRVALWGEKADVDVGPGDRMLVADVEIEDGFRDDLEAAANWQSTVAVLDDDPPAGDETGAPTGGTGATPGGGTGTTSGRGSTSGSGATGGRSGDDGGGDDAGLGAFTDDGPTAGADAGGPSTGADTDGPGAGADAGSSPAFGAQSAPESDHTEMAIDEIVEFTGTVVQAGDPVVLDDGDSTVSVETDADCRLGERVTVRGRMEDGRLVADEVR